MSSGNSKSPSRITWFKYSINLNQMNQQSIYLTRAHLYQWIRHVGRHNIVRPGKRHCSRQFRQASLKRSFSRVKTSRFLYIYIIILLLSITPEEIVPRDFSSMMCIMLLEEMVSCRISQTFGGLFHFRVPSCVFNLKQDAPRKTLSQKFASKLMHDINYTFSLTKKKPKQ